MTAIKANKLTILFIIASLFIHLLLLLLYFVQPNNQPFLPKTQQPETPRAFVSAYSYQEKGSLYEKPKPKTEASTKKIENVEEIAQKQKMESPQPIKDLSALKKETIALKPTQSFTAASFDFLKSQQIKEMSHSEESEPIYLIGETNQPPSLLIKLLARALSRHFHYPEHAGRFGIRGKTLVSFTLHPDGNISDVRIIQSSNIKELDVAALYATNQAPRISGADRFLSKPKSFVVGFVFR